MSAVGSVAFTRRYWKCTCGADGSYAADEPLGVAGQRYTKAVQKHACRLAAGASFASASEDLHEILGVDVCPETARKVVQGHGRKMARFQAEDTASEEAFRQAPGEVEFTTDAGKVNTREEGWKDLKIGVVAKRKAGEPTSPDEWKSQRLPLAAMVLAFAMIAPAKQFRKSWRPRLRRLGVRCMASLHVLADGDLEGRGTRADRLRADAGFLPRLPALKPLRRARLRRGDRAESRGVQPRPGSVAPTGLGRGVPVGE